MSTRHRTYGTCGFLGVPEPVLAGNRISKKRTRTLPTIYPCVYIHTRTQYITVWRRRIYTDTNTHTHTHTHDRQFGRSRYRRHPSRLSLEVGAPIPRAAARVWSPGGRPVFISSVVVVVVIVLYIYIIYYSSILKCVIYLYIYIKNYIHSVASPNYSDR